MRLLFAASRKGLQSIAIQKLSSVCYFVTAELFLCFDCVGPVLKTGNCHAFQIASKLTVFLASIGK